MAITLDTHGQKMHNEFVARGLNSSDVFAFLEAGLSWDKIAQLWAMMQKDGPAVVDIALKLVMLVRSGGAADPAVVASFMAKYDPQVKELVLDLLDLFNVPHPGPDVVPVEPVPKAPLFSETPRESAEVAETQEDFSETRTPHKKNKHS